MLRHDLQRFARPALRPPVPPAALLLMGLICAAAAKTYGDVYIGRSTTFSSRQTGGPVCIGWPSEKDYNNDTHSANPTVNIIKDAAITADVHVENASTLNMSGGFVKGDVAGLNHSVVNISGGVITGIVEAAQYATVTISGGTINGSSPRADPPDSMAARGHSVLTLRGGHIAARVVIEEKATFHVYGTGLKATRASHVPTGNYYALSGTLADGTVLHTRLRVYDSARFVLHNTGSGSGSRVH